MSSTVSIAVSPASLLHLARGCYQRSLLLGQSRWSGADLRGKARSYSARYAGSRDAVVARILAAGYTVSWTGGTSHTGPMQIVIAQQVPAVADYSALAA